MEYPYIVAYGRMMGSYQHYINDQIEQAKKDHAPANAVFKNRDTGKWHTVEELEPGTQWRVEAQLERLTAKK